MRDKIKQKLIKLFQRLIQGRKKRYFISSSSPEHQDRYRKTFSSK
ncbi:MAG: hypothetical protein V1825_03390 [Candidatus Falkowbacteria bacterium]